MALPLRAFATAALVGALLPGCATVPKQPAHETLIFICEHGAAKSVIAAAYFNRLAEARGLTVRAIARGADPQPDPSVATLAGLERDGFTITPEKPRPVTGADIRGSSEVVVFDCTTAPMKPLSALGSCWNDVPAIADGYDAARERIRAHVEALLRGR